MRDIYRIFWKELVQVFRDRKLVFSTLILPVLLMPIFMFGPSLVLQRLLQGAQERKQEVAVLNLPEEALRALEQAGLSPKAHPDPEGAVREGKYPVGVRYEQGVYRVYGRLAGGLTEGQVAVSKVQGALQALKEAKVAEALAQRGIPHQVLTPFQVEVVDTSPEREKAGGLLGFLLPFFLVVFVLTGGQVVAVDATAGEKEKGTLEALLMAPVPLLHLAMGKTLATVAMALLSGISGLLGLALGSTMAATFGGGLLTESGQILELGGRLALDGTGFLALFLSAFLLALFMGAVMVSLGLYARSFKEAQSYMAPLQLLVLLPLIFLQFRGFFELQTWHHLVPLFNVALLMDALLKGSASPLQAGLTWGSTLVYAGLALLVAVRVFSREEVVFRN
ncbi:ABC transporter permease [Thermus scotoductus]|uniref:Sodium ABC transporter permease n=1 Tax=Thermus scotoductus TaxID=37636 RepID=A0A430R152_THESC|nr:ABC transporter permease [Thermus scotoductus]RTG93198.1 sodium ABC transporter permease [Thermus scotoductus]RTH01115.1 sodium ABC transporter permease [Thermus scotoductus]RTH19370.1 sodium ABC transporter permease [Thermus scotoductus]RTH96766.1 sodium ABC transporter permease [Thermus scotoductus]RTI18022.1 sodium ABC transporter permease [Thermus scotoductus]